MTDPAAAAARLRAYLNARPDAPNLGGTVEYGPEFTADNGRPAGVYALDRADLAAVLDERDQLAAALRQHETCRTCSHERHEHDYDGVIRAQYCGRCTVGRDVHDFQPEERP